MVTANRLEVQEFPIYFRALVDGAGNELGRSGLRGVVNPPMLKAFRARIIGVRPAELTELSFTIDQGPPMIIGSFICEYLSSWPGIYGRLFDIDMQYSYGSDEYYFQLQECVVENYNGVRANFNAMKFIQIPEESSSFRRVWELIPSIYERFLNE